MKHKQSESARSAFDAPSSRKRGVAVLAAFVAAAVIRTAAGVVVPYGAAPQQCGDLHLPDEVSSETPKLLSVYDVQK